MASVNIDYSLYLDVDSSAEALKGRDLLKVVQGALEGGVTVVQLRDSVNGSAAKIQLASRLHTLTEQYKVPLIIHGRVDVALAVGAQGVHIGHGDIGLSSARKLLGDKAIIGVTVSSVEEAQKAAKEGANYLGIAPKPLAARDKNPDWIVGTNGTKDILTSLSAMDEKVATVLLGDISATNAQRIIYQSKALFKGLDGVAVLSAITEAEDPKKAASELKALLKQPPPFAALSGVGVRKVKDVRALLQIVPTVLKVLRQKVPLCHHVTSVVVQSFSSNVALAIGVSPIMASYGEEAEDLACVGDSLLVDMGSVKPDVVRDCVQALVAYNTKGGPVVLDPIGAGATGPRKIALRRLMAAGYFDVIKGNEGEIRAVAAESGVQQRQVESAIGALSAVERARLVKKLAARERNVVIMTGVTDYVSDGERTFSLGNGHEYLGRVTGTGCTVGTAVAACVAVHRDDKLLAVIAAMLLFEIAAEHAALRDDVKGPGTFVPVFIDELYGLSKQTASGNNGWLAAARVQEMDV